MTDKDKELSRLESLISLRQEEYQVDLVNILHELEFCKSEENFKQLTSKEPAEGLTDKWFQYVFVAGVIEFFALRKGWEAPDWVYDIKYVLDEEWWALDDGGEGKARQFIFSPACFMKRNIFIDGETLIPL